MHGDILNRLDCFLSHPSTVFNHYCIFICHSILHYPQKLTVSGNNEEKYNGCYIAVPEILHISVYFVSYLIERHSSKSIVYVMSNGKMSKEAAVAYFKSLYSRNFCTQFV